MEWVCQQHDEKQSATTRPASGRKKMVGGDYALPLEESSTRDGLEEYDLEALIGEAYDIVKSHIEAEEGFIKKTGPRGSKDAEEDASLRTKDGAYVEAARTYNVDMGEGAERATLSSCRKGTSMEKAGNYRVMSDTSRMGGSFGAWLPETSSAVAQNIERGKHNRGLHDRGRGSHRKRRPDGGGYGHDNNEQWCRDLSHTGSTDFGKSATRAHVRPERLTVATARRATKTTTRKIVAAGGEIPRHRCRRLRWLCPSNNIRPGRWTTAVRRRGLEWAYSKRRRRRLVTRPRATTRRESESDLIGNPTRKEDNSIGIPARTEEEGRGGRST